eukprot:TRINITY_DN110503_c0_g1_i1.p1 TRINITY_DN110503_c0_g1~~TRINITY_DN110503_c0_g1_i1.p1  ORF type:complete len:393 (+),score=68.48 TRINITY_DN110503_c0_g1_i1:173-1180(+)
MSSFATRALHGVMNIMKEHGDVMVCVEGHCRPDEADSLSSERANRVLEELVRQGVPRHRLRAAGFGASFSNEEGSGGKSSRPIGGTSGSARVEFSVIQEIAIKGTVQFGQCADNLTKESDDLLESVAALLLARPCLRVRIEGHTDNAPNWGCTNMELSDGRARSVVKALLQRGIEENRLVPVGFGPNLPRISNDSRDGRKQNRRVEFHILQKETVRGLRDLVQAGVDVGVDGKRKRADGSPSHSCDLSSGKIDKAALRQLTRTAEGEGSCPLALPIRRAAADVLRRLGADWPLQRLLHIAGRKEDPSICPIARLPEECIHHIERMYFLLGCFNCP